MSERAPVPQESEPADQRLDVFAAVKEAAIAALVAFGLFVLMIGIRTDQGPTGALVLTTRFGALAAIVAAVFAAALLRATIWREVAGSIERLVPVAVRTGLSGVSRYAAVTGWKLAPITRYEYGVPFTFNSAVCNVVSQVREGCLPGRLAGQQLLLHGRNGFDPTKNNGQYINPNALEPASSFTGAYGYLGTGSAVTSSYGPNFRDTDFSLIKETKFHDRGSFEFTANFFNAFNNHYFIQTGEQTSVSSAFNTAVGATGFGQWKWNGQLSTYDSVLWATGVLIHSSLLTVF